MARHPSISVFVVKTVHFNTGKFLAIILKQSLQTRNLREQLNAFISQHSIKHDNQVLFQPRAADNIHIITATDNISWKYSCSTRICTSTFRRIVFSLFLLNWDTAGHIWRRKSHWSSLSSPTRASTYYSPLTHIQYPRSAIITKNIAESALQLRRTRQV